MLAAFHQGLSQTGFVVGRNVKVEYRWAAGQANLESIAADLVRRRGGCPLTGRGLGMISLPFSRDNWRCNALLASSARTHDRIGRS
jgi:hypothetical protein